MNSAPLPTRILGSTGRAVTTIGLGGEGVLRTHGLEPSADAVIDTAVSSGISYFDSARAYAGSEGYYGNFWSRNPAARAKVFITSKSASRDAAGARQDLQTTLRTLKVSHIDLWQIHDVRTEYDLSAITRRGGALEAFLEAKEKGVVRHIGVTGHHDPLILKKAVRELPVETVLLPVNVVEGVIGGFLTEVIPEARRKKMGVIGMKVLGQGMLLDAGLSARELLRYAFSQDVDTLIVGCSSAAEVTENIAIATEAARPECALSAADTLHLLSRVRRRAKDLAYYRGRI